MSNYSALAAKGPVADAIATTWWIMFWGASAVLLLVMALLFYAMYRSNKPRLRTRAFVFGGGLVFPAVTLAALLIYGTGVGERITRSADSPLRVEVTGHQWWWEVRYPGEPAVVTANELHVPVGVPVELTLHSSDVIHSLWIPSLAGKVDLIPGRTNLHRFEASEAGRFGGQCAELCGAQHALMKLTIVAQPQAEFDAWRAARATTPPVDVAGARAFADAGCALCHRVAGTDADGTDGPDLTHLAARATLGADTVPNGPEHLRTWLASHGATVKPDNTGAGYALSDPALVEALARYLEHSR
ncbi:MAG: cytochrome c oxidase subunit II [Gammaproteobacteria bacterium]